MASSPKMSRTGFHARYVSLPSRPHPTVPEYDEILCRLKSSESASSSPSSIRNSLEGLQDLHDCLYTCHSKYVDKVLSGSLQLLDLCGTGRESLLMTKECAQEPQSSLRRKGSDAKEAAKYMACRKIVKKSIQKALRNLKDLETSKSQMHRASTPSINES
uniref:Uncharacterized protein n=1 Tax=Kalanchoe fedtschenkoi TaxID=63787 RepID=A0A7N1A329_KALFE